VASLGAKAGACFDEELHHKDNGDPTAAKVAIICKTMINISGHEQQVNFITFTQMEEVFIVIFNLVLKIVHIQLLA